MKNRFAKLFIALTLIASLVAVAAGCGSTGGGSATTAAPAATTAAPAGGETTAAPAGGETSEFPSYKLIANTWGAGAYPLDELQSWQEYTAALAGCTIETANNEFTADKVVSQLESQLASQPDGALYCLQVAATFEPCINDFDNAGVPYAWSSNFPSDEELMKRCQEDELYAGGVNPDPYNQGVQMAEMALADGNKTAVITGAAIGDFNHDNRILGFTEAFEAGGGKVLQVSHSSDPSEAVQKTNDLFSANPDADCVYGSGGDFLSAAVTCLDGRSDVNPNMMVYGTDIDPTLVPLVAEGKVAGMNGSQGVQGSLALVLLINALDGHRIVDENGQGVNFLNLECAMITPENAAAYQAGYEAGVSWVGDENYKNLLYRFNPDVTLDDFNNFFENFAAASLAAAESCQ